MSSPPADHDIKVAQAENFDNLNAIVAETAFDRHLRFLNFGYRVLPGEESCGPKLGFAFPNKDSAQLLFQTIGDTSLDGAQLVEVGCGRGGNLWLIGRHHAVDQAVGIDIAAGSVAHCAQTNPEPHLQFLVGDAEQLPLADACADAVLSVETGATYPDIEQFFREAVRVLRPGGHLLYADIVHHEIVPRHVALLERLGMEVIEQRDISANVVAARNDRAERQALAFAKASPEDQTTMAEFSGLTGSVLYNEFAGGVHRYVIIRLRRDRVVEPPADRILTPHERALARVTSEIAVETLTMASAHHPNGPDTANGSTPA